jgi:hypothetical protein
MRRRRGKYRYERGEKQVCEEGKRSGNGKERRHQVNVIARFKIKESISIHLKAQPMNQVTMAKYSGNFGCRIHGCNKTDSSDKSMSKKASISQAYNGFFEDFDHLCMNRRFVAKAMDEADVQSLHS